MTKIKTPSSHWAVNGEVDPHKGKYDCDRCDLTLGQLTDDELANEVFMWGDNKPTMREILDGTAKMPVIYLTAGKERIRWLSRQNDKNLAKITKLEKALEASLEVGKEYCDDNYTIEFNEAECKLRKMIV